MANKTIWALASIALAITSANQSVSSGVITAISEKSGLPVASVNDLAKEIKAARAYARHDMKNF